MLLEQVKKSLGLDANSQLSGSDIATMAELVCTLNFNPSSTSLSDDEKAAEAAADEYQAQVGAVLAEAYRNGDAGLGLTRDLWKAQKYARKKELEDSILRTEKAYWALGLFTSWRLFILRVNRILTLKELIKNVTVPIAKVTQITGLSYGFELIADLAVIARTTFFPSESEKNHTPSGWERFKNIMKKDNRIPRMLNAAAWFSVNLACLFLTGGLSVVALNLGLFAFDIVNDTFRGIREYNKYPALLAEIRNKKTSLSQTIQNCNDPNKLPAYQLELKKYFRIEAAILEKQKANMKTRAFFILISVAMFVGMLMVLAPHIFVAAAAAVAVVKLVGAAVAVSGSVLSLGKRFYDFFSSFKSQPSVTEGNKNQPHHQHIPHLLAAAEPAAPLARAGSASSLAPSERSAVSSNASTLPPASPSSAGLYHRAPSVLDGHQHSESAPLLGDANRADSDRASPVAGSATP